MKSGSLMNSLHSLTIRTLSPVRSPISADSERRAAEALKDGFASSGGQRILPDSTTMEPFEWPWSTGYGTLDHDNLPAFFRPFGCYHVTVSESVCPEALLSFFKEHSGEIATCSLYLYDDTVALLQMDVVFQTGTDHSGALLESDLLDRALSDCAANIYRAIIYPEFCRYAASFDKKVLRHQKPPENGLRDPNKLTVFRDVAFTAGTAPDSYVLWTGRYIVVPPTALDDSAGDSLRRWVSYPGAKADLLEERQFVGSGNILVLSEYPVAEAESWFRGLAVCQLYNAILSIYGGILKSSYSELNDFGAKRSRKNKDLHRLMTDITRTLDHLEFTRLEFNEALVGMQAGRAKVVKAACEAWNLDGLIQGALERTDLIRSKISRLLEARKSELNRSVELILAGIGGVALIDLFISLTTASRDLGDDRVPGLLDVFLWLPPDGSIALSTLLLVAVSGYIYRAKR